MHAKEYVSLIQEFIGDKVSPNIAKDVCDFIYSFRYLKDEFIYYPQIVLKDLFESKTSYDLVYYPCDVVELRLILKQGNVTDKKRSFYFSHDFIKKHLLDNPIFVGFEVKAEQFGNLFMVENERPKIKRIYIKEEFVNSEIAEMVYKVVEQEGAKVEINAATEIPGLKVKKADAFNAKKFAQQTEEIQLTEQEKEIFHFLRYAKQIRPETLGNVEMRVAGGWVRDKLMGKPSDDIDIALSNITGGKFVKELKDVSEHLLSARKPVGKTYLVDQNVEKSKHLETAGVDLYGLKVEFVNLRTETYDEKSRIPTMAVTDDPKEDAQRRDLTINAMFYNIETGQVEDYVNGREDLKNMILRTPLEPKKTFEDDPIRMLRVLRFHSRYSNSQIDPAIIEAMKDPEVQKRYTKLSPERASKEIRKMMEGNQPSKATRILLETGLYKPVFQIPQNWRNFDMDQMNDHHKLNLMEHTLAVMDNYEKIAKANNLPKEERGLMMLSTLMHDFGKMVPHIQTPHPKKPNQMRYIGHDDASADFAKDIMTKMGFEPSEKKFVEIVVRNHMVPHDFADRGKMTPKAMGRFLFDTGNLYKRVMEHAQADALSKGAYEEGEVDNIVKGRQQNITDIEKYKTDMGDLLTKNVIDGNAIKVVATEIAPDMVNANGMITLSNGKKHYLKYLTEKLQEAQWEQKIKTPEEAMVFIRGAVKQAAQLWRQQNGLKAPNIPTKPSEPVEDQQALQKARAIVKQRFESMTPEQQKALGDRSVWFRSEIAKEIQNLKQAKSLEQIKVADASSGTGPESGIESGSSYEGSSAMEKKNDIVHAPDYAITKYRVGGRILLRAGGLAFEPIEGRIKSIGNNKMIVEWTSGKYKGKRTGYDLTDTVSLSVLEVLS